MTSSIQKWHWRESESAPGTYKRALDECETFYRVCTRAENGCFPVTGCAAFTYPENLGRSSFSSSSSENINGTGSGTRIAVEDAFRKAWISLRFMHPSLASWVETEDQDGQEHGRGQLMRVYSNITADAQIQSKELDLWLNDTFSVITVEGPDGAEECFNKDASDFEFASVYLIHQASADDNNEHSSKKSNIFLRCPHDITDGIGILQLLQQLFGYAAKALEEGNGFVMPTFGNEGARLSPCLRVAAGIHETLSSEQAQRWEDIQRMNARLYTEGNVCLLGLPSSRTCPDIDGSTGGGCLTGRRIRRSIRLPNLTTQQILRQCKTIGTGVSITHVFIAALALVLAQLQEKLADKGKDENARISRYINHSMINLRPYVQPPYNSPEHAAAAYHTVSAQTLALDVYHGTATDADLSEGDLPRLAGEVRDFFHSILPPSNDSNNTPDQTTFAPLTFRSFTPPPGANPHTVSNPPFCPVPLSHIGNISNIVSKTHGVLELENVWASSEPLGAGVALFLSTWDGKLELCAVFDEGYHGGIFIEGFLGRVVACVCDGLGLEAAGGDELCR